MTPPLPMSTVGNRYLTRRLGQAAEGCQAVAGVLIDKGTARDDLTVTLEARDHVLTVQVREFTSAPWTRYPRRWLTWHLEDLRDGATAGPTSGTMDLGVGARLESAMVALGAVVAMVPVK